MKNKTKQNTSSWLNLSSFSFSRWRTTSWLSCFLLPFYFLWPMKQQVDKRSRRTSMDDVDAVYASVLIWLFDSVIKRRRDLNIGQTHDCYRSYSPIDCLFDFLLSRHPHRLNHATWPPKKNIATDTSILSIIKVDFDSIFKLSIVHFLFRVIAEILEFLLFYLKTFIESIISSYHICFKSSLSSVFFIIIHPMANRYGLDTDRRIESAI